MDPLPRTKGQFYSDLQDSEIGRPSFHHPHLNSLHRLYQIQVETMSGLLQNINITPRQKLLVVEIELLL